MRRGFVEISGRPFLCSGEKAPRPAPDIGAVSCQLFRDSSNLSVCSQHKTASGQTGAKRDSVSSIVASTSKRKIKTNLTTSLYIRRQYVKLVTSSIPLTRENPMKYRVQITAVHDCREVVVELFAIPGLVGWSARDVFRSAGRKASAIGIDHELLTQRELEYLFGVEHADSTIDKRLSEIE